MRATAERENEEELWAWVARWSCPHRGGNTRRATGENAADLWRRRAAGSCAAQRHDRADGSEHDQKIQGERLMADVVEIVLELAQRVLDGAAVAELDLRPAGETRCDGEARAIEGELFRQH